MRGFRVLVAVAFTAISGLAGGCSSSPSPEPDADAGSAVASSPAGGDTTSEGTDPCSLLTTAEINAATGRTFSDGAINEQVTQENLVACDWHGDTGIDTVQVLISTVGAYDSYRQTAIDVFGDAPDATVPGTVRAFMMPDGSLIGMDMGNGVFLQVSYVSVNADPRAAIQELAPKAAGRMT